MSFDRHFRSRDRAVWIRTILASVALVAIFAARGAPPQFVGGASDHSISADSHHDQRPRFDFSNIAWSPPVPTFVLFPPSSRSTNLNSPLRLFSTLQSTGFHFNRPPPAN